MTTTPDYIRASLHPVDIDDDGHHAATVMYAECNTPPAGSANFDFDTFYDINAADLSLVIPAAMGLVYSGMNFEATESGIWLINVSVEMIATPGEDGDVRITSPTYGSNPLQPVASAQGAFRWNATIFVPMRASEAFGLLSDMPTVAAATYATIDIVRIARSVS